MKLTCVLLLILAGYAAAESLDDAAKNIEKLKILNQCASNYVRLTKERAENQADADYKVIRARLDAALDKMVAEAKKRDGPGKFPPALRDAKDEANKVWTEINERVNQGNGPSEKIIAEAKAAYLRWRQDCKDVKLPDDTAKLCEAADELAKR